MVRLTGDGATERHFHGSLHGYSVRAPETAMTLPVHLARRKNGDGVAWGGSVSCALRGLGCSAAGGVPLRIADSFDDMEGHGRPVESGAGYGDSLTVLAPGRPLQPDTPYGLRFERARYGGGVIERGGADWTSAPAATVSPGDGHEALLLIHLPLAPATEPPHVVAEPRPPRGEQGRRLVALLPPREAPVRRSSLPMDGPASRLGAPPGDATSTGCRRSTRTASPPTYRSGSSCPGRRT